MARGINKLTEAKIARLNKPGRYNDGGGLYLQVSPTGSKAWTFRKWVNGENTYTGLGSLLDIDLEEARTKAKAMRAAIKDGRDPQAARAALKVAASNITFLNAARGYAEDHKAAWKNPTHRRQWFTNMLGEDEDGKKVEPEHNYCAALHGVDVRDIDVARVKAVLQPIWLTKAETARRIRGRIEAVLDWATTHEYRAEGRNPAAWKGVLINVLPKQEASDDHHATIPVAALPAFMRELRKQDGIAARALAFLILTGTSTADIIGVKTRDDAPPMMWDHIDIDGEVWTIPLVKNGSKNFPVPLSAPALAILAEMKRLTNGQGLVFPGPDRDKEGNRLPLSNGGMASVLRRMGVKATPHGLARAGLKTWGEHETKHPTKVIEACLRHGKMDKLSEAYQRESPFFKKRVKLMNDWAAFLTTSAPPELRVVAG